MKITSIRLTNFQAFADSGLIPLWPLTILVGKNNSGKSAVLNAIRTIQAGATTLTSRELIRIGAGQATIELQLQDIRRSSRSSRDDEGLLRVVIPPGAAPQLSFNPPPDGPGGAGWNQFPNELPNAVLLPLPADSALDNFDEQVNQETSRRIQPDMRNLSALISSQGQLFADASRDLIGFPISLIPSQTGQLPGWRVDDETDIKVGAMGAGVIRMARLLALLGRVKGRILLVEEPENDLHPEALRGVLDLLKDVAKENQVIITTHSHIVVNFLGGVDGSAVYRVAMEFEERVPTARITPCVSRQARLDVLRELGHELADFGLFDAYLILEEASAETIIKRLLGWFTPKLASRIRTVAANGVNDTGPRFRNLRRLFVFTHLEPVYHGRSWVVVDGDEAGIDEIEKLKLAFEDWPPHHFQSLSQPDFELYYPPQFQADAAVALGGSGGKQQQVKEGLLLKVLAWIDEDDERARTEFEVSAAPVIKVLKGIEEAVLRNPTAVAVTQALLALRPQVHYTVEDQTGEVIDLATMRTATYAVQPGAGAGASWRFGLKFGESLPMSEGKLVAGHPLWHLTKNAGEDRLYATYYDAAAALQDEVPVRTVYKGEEVVVHLDVVGDTSLRLGVGGDIGYEKTYPLVPHQYALPSAWADGDPVDLHVTTSQDETD